MKTKSFAFIDICKAVQKAHIEHYQREYDRLTGRPERRYDHSLRDVDKRHPPKQQMTLAEAINRYVEDPSRIGAAPKTRAAWKFKFAAWKDILGADKFVAEITRDEIRAGVELLMRVPLNAPKLYPGVPLAKVAVEADKRGLRPLGAKSIQLYVDALNALFRYLEEEQIVTKNPARGLKGPRVQEEEPRRPWTVEELNLLFRTPPFDVPWRTGRKRSWLFWMPLIALFSGAREGELAGLKREDVYSVDGVWMVRLFKNDLRALKNLQSKRAFPVHPRLIQLGFIEFVLGVPAGGLLFSDISKTKLGPAHCCQKALGPHIRRLISDPKVVFHSFRHNFRDAAREANLPVEVVAQIGGWTDGTKSAMAGYGKGHSPKALAAWMAKIEYPGLKLEHLVPVGDNSLKPIREVA